MSASYPHFIIIDDSQLDCFIGEKIIQNTGTYSSVKSFAEAKDALNTIRDNPVDPEDPMTIIVLDIQMPFMNGFQFVEAFEQLPDDIRSKYVIFMFSSSINESDKNRIENHPAILKFYSKPISKETVANMITYL